MQDPSSCEDTQTPNSSYGRQARKRVQQGNNQKHWNALQVIEMSSEIKTGQKIAVTGNFQSKKNDKITFHDQESFLPFP